jgi:starch phosphorylase
MNPENWLNPAGSRPAPSKITAAAPLIFLEDYDINIARYLVQVVDILDEQSAPSPMKPQHYQACTTAQRINGAVNFFSILDGWWREGYNGKTWLGRS